MNFNFKALRNLLKPKRPYIMGSGKINKYGAHVAMDGHRVLPSGAIVVRTLSVKGSSVSEGYDALVAEKYAKDLEAFNNPESVSTDANKSEE